LFTSILNDAGKQLRKLINVALKRLTAGQDKSKGDDEDFEFDELDRRLQELSDQVEKQPEQYEAKKRDLDKLPPVSPPSEGRQKSDKSHLEEERKRQEEEAKKQEAEKQRAEEERVKKEQEAKRLEDEKKKKQEEEKKRAEEEKAKKDLEEKQRLEEEKRKQEEERLKKEQEAKKRANDERAKQEQEAKRIEEEKKKQEDERKKAEDESKRAEEEKKKQEEEAKRKLSEAEQKQKQVTQAAPVTKSPAVPRAKEPQDTERKALLSAWKEITGGNKQPVTGLKGSGSPPNVSTQANASKAAATSSEVKVKQLVTKFVPDTTSTHSAPTDPANVSERASTSSLARNEKYRNILSFWHLKDAEASANTTQK
jgi:DNA repair exonuclease SbcCD ATPase subunit